MQPSLHLFLSLLQQFGSDLPDLSELSSVPAALESGADTLRDAFSVLADQHSEVLGNGGPEEALALFLHFQLAGRVKDMLLLYRDSLFQHLKGQALAADGKLDQKTLEQHWTRSREILLKAGEELSQWTETQSQACQADSPASRKQRSQWRLQNNPWAIYREQLTAICDQCRFLRENAASVRSGIDTFHAIGNLIRQTLILCMDEIRQLAKQAENTQNWLEQTDDKSPKVAGQLDEMNENLLLPQHAKDFTRQLDGLAVNLPEKEQVAVSTKDGWVQRIDVDLRRRVNQWLEGEVLPLLYEVWELNEAAYIDLKLSLSNIRNRVLLLTDGVEPYLGGQLVQPLVRSQAAFSHSLQQCGELENLLEERLQAHFFLSGIFQTDQTFLPLSMQTTVRQLGMSQGRTFQRLYRWLSGRLAFLQNFWRKVEREEQLGFAEKTARYLVARQPDPSNAHYVPIFQTHGFVGASFAVGREVEMEHMDNLVRQWQSGFRGAAVITGRRFSGKTFFGEWVASRLFTGNVLRLSPSQPTVVKGRKLAATRNLDAVLDFLKKYALDSRPLIWIDDLEYWQDSGHTLYENAEALIRFIDQNATRCFVLVAVNEWTHSFLEQQMGFEKAFQALFEMGDLSREEMVQAVLIRHGATHKKLVRADGEELHRRQVANLISRVRRLARGNIGETLQWWTAAIRTYDEESVRSLFSEHFTVPELPRLQDADMALVFKEVLMQKRTDEYRLRKQFGPAFQNRYAHLVRRLLALGLLIRLPDGGLQVQETAVNALADQLMRST